MKSKKNKLNLIDELADIENNQSPADAQGTKKKNQENGQESDWSNVLGIQVDPNKQKAG